MQGGAMAYRASKAALNMMAACYAEEQAQDGVKVLALHPGEYLTIYCVCDAWSLLLL